MAQRGCGCLPIVLGVVLGVLWLGTEPGLVDGPALESETYDPRSPRRPMPVGTEEDYIIDQEPAQQDSQGTAFVIDSDGVWLTAEHVTHGCSRLGLAEGTEGYRVYPVTRVLESAESDASLIYDGVQSTRPLALSGSVPAIGSAGLHMGFPAGEPMVVLSQLIGTAQARRGGLDGAGEPILAWAEVERFPPTNGALGGISGGPTFGENGRVIGINSAATERRGRVLTTDPRAIARLVKASNAVDESPDATPFASADEAVARFRGYLRDGVIRQVYCDVQ